MATRRRGDTARERPVTRSASTRAATNQPVPLTNGIAHENGVDEEEEYHTEESEAGIEDIAELQQQAQAQEANNLEPHGRSDDDDSISELAPSGPALLPISLLQPLPSPAYLPAILPRSQMSRKDKRAERTRSRRAKKLQWDRIRDEAKANGVVAAGRVAQIQRGVVGTGGERVKSGGVQKVRPVGVSGRQRMVEKRKREVERSLGDGKKVKTRPRR